MRIDQILAGYAEGDAISHAARVIRDLLRGWGIAADLFVDRRHVSPSVRDEVRDLAEYAGSPADTVLHHYSIASAALDRFASARARRILVYHNITPADFFHGFDDSLAAQLASARATLGPVARQCAACWAVSRFNAAELEALGIPAVSVFPLVFDPRPLDMPDDPEVLKRVGGGGLDNILFVGRIVPNKSVESLIEAYAYYHRDINPFSRLVIVGSERSCPRYFAMLRMMVGDLDLPNVCFEGFASVRGLPTYYRASRVLVSPSRHEGYCLPLLEAMHCGVPVIARATGGVPEALHGAGAMYEDLEPAALAVLIDRVLRDAALRQTILASQQRRLESVRHRDIGAELKSLLGL